MSLELLFLGTGTSAGVPMIGCRCAVCTSDDPRDRRSRPSVLIRHPDPDKPQHIRHILIDTTPELRQQALAHQLDRLDAVLYTHAHADHIFGLDDLRRFNAVMRQPLDIYAEPAVLQRLATMFSYVFDPGHNINQSFVAQLIAHPIDVDRPLSLFGATWTQLRLLHGRLPILGFRVDYRGAALAYCTDVSAIPPQTYPLLQDLDVLVIDALRYRHHPTHLTVDQALHEIEQLQPRQAWFTHIAHDIQHADLSARLPAHIQPAHDGLLLTLNGDHP
jgi:phosphoribosyl 1,2-cyclic phosphate phosphodiesterase